MSVSRRIAAATALARANFVAFERPDRMLLAVASAAPWGLTATAALAASVARQPHRPAVVDETSSLTYRDLWRRSDAIAEALSRCGAGPGVAVGMLCRNSTRFAEVIAGIAKTGADLVLLNTGFAAPQLADVAATERLSIIVHDDEFVDLVASCTVASRIDGTAIAVAAESGGTVAPCRHQGRTTILTSGTTGRPKGATRNLGAGAMEGAASLLERIPLRPRDVQVVAAPLFHAWGLSHLMFGLARCATTVVAPQFDPEATLASIASHRAQVLVVVPVMLQRMLAVPLATSTQADASTLRVVAVSGSSLGGRLASEVADRWGPVLYNTYGSTEVAIASVATPADLRDHPTTVGRPAPGVRVELLDVKGNPVPPGAIGRIFVGNAARFDGYTGGGGKETHDGLLASGDVGHFDEHHLLYVDGRDDDMIVSGGENVYPGEVEELLLNHGEIVEAAVVGVDDHEFGQSLAAFVVRRTRSDLDADDVRRYVRQNLARFKVPRTVTFVEELPRNPAGKVVKPDLLA